jgi:hypothetical protein
MAKHPHANPPENKYPPIVQHIFDMWPILVVLAGGIYYLGSHLATIDANQATMAKDMGGLATKESVQNAVSQQATKIDLANLRNDLTALSEQLRTVSRDVDTIRNNANRVSFRARYMPVKSWLLTVGDDFGMVRVLLIDADTGKTRQWEPPAIAGGDKQLQMAAVWAAAGGTDLQADTLDVYEPYHSDAKNPVSKLWLGCSFAMIVAADKMPNTVASTFLGNSVTENRNGSPTTYEKLVDFLNANQDLIKFPVRIKVPGPPPAPPAGRVSQSH